MWRWGALISGMPSWCNSMKVKRIHSPEWIQYGPKLTLAVILPSAQGITMDPKAPTSNSGVTLEDSCLLPLSGLICLLPNSQQFLPAKHFFILIPTCGPIATALGQASKSPPFSVPPSTSLLLTLMPHCTIYKDFLKQNLTKSPPT